MGDESQPRTSLPLTSSHWGTYRVETDEDRVVALHPFEHDPDPSPIGPGIVGVLDGPTRIDQPMVRRSWLSGGPGANPELRGVEPFVAVDWDTANRLVADELDRVRTSFGNEAIFAGSYGWASAGRFHHAQGQLRRFLNTIGGHASSKNTYSFAAGEVVVPHILGGFRAFVYGETKWDEIAEHADLVVAFGGIPLKNGQISQGGVGAHRQRDGVVTAAEAGVSFVNVSPLRSDTLDSIGAEWLAPRPSTDTALLLAMATTLIEDDLVDRDFVDRCTVGYDRFAAYLTGEVDGVAKTAEWAAEICDLDAGVIRDLARRMATESSVLSIAWSMTRQDHGEQPFWAGIALASMLGQIGLPGRGFAFGLSAMNSVGNRFAVLPVMAFPQGPNPVDAFIPVARISDMLLEPGTEFDYDGGRYTYPDARLVWWAGGNPFHHHQDLNRMIEAWRRPDTIIVNEWCWNAHAKHADIVLPATTPLEREDIAMAGLDPFVVKMDKVVEPNGLARSDHEIFLGIAEAMGVGEEFSGGRSERQWLEWLYDESRRLCAAREVELPPLADLERDRWFEAKQPAAEPSKLGRFRDDPEGERLATPSGRIEIFSETIASFGLDDCGGHPTWYEPGEWLGHEAAGTQLHLISNQPQSKLHGQLDHGPVSREAKRLDPFGERREPATIHPDDAAARGIADGDLIRLFNDRGACLCVATVSDLVRSGVMQVSTGAWFDPATPGMASDCKHGNPNVVTRDKGTSKLAQGPTAHSCLVEVERVDDAGPPVTAFEPPEILRGDQAAGLRE